MPENVPALDTTQTFDKSLTQTNSIVQLIFNIIRMLVKISLLIYFLYQPTTNTPFLVGYLLFSEVIDFIIINYHQRIRLPQSTLAILFTLNFIFLTMVISYSTGWVTNDFYLVYLLLIASATFLFGPLAGIISLVLSCLTYLAFLVINQTPLEMYIRIPVLIILGIQFVSISYKYEQINQYLTRVLDIEKAKKNFISIASHNLRTPVAAIYGYIEVLLRGDTGSLNPEQAQLIDRIKLNNAELDTLVEQLLQISIYEVGEEVNLFRQPCQIEMIIKDLTNSFSSLTRQKNLKLIFHQPNTTLPLLYIDVEKIKSVLRNIIDNAIKYTEQGQIEISTAVEDDTVKVTIADTGIGIPAEDLPKVFNRFYRSGNVLVYNQPGAGLGLYLGKQIVELHGGEITVNSQQGKGTQFTVELPIMSEQNLRQ